MPPIQPPLPPALRRALTTLQTERQAALPAVEGLQAEFVLRWLYRTSREESGSHWLLLRFPVAALQARDALADAVALAQGAWVALDAAPPPNVQAALLAVCRGLWLPTTGPAIPLDPATRARVLRIDAQHAVATDRALQGLRKALTAHCENAGIVLITGQPGSGRRSLARWAHATLDNRSMAHIARGSRDRAQPGQWALFDGLESLDADQRTSLESRISEQNEPDALTTLPLPTPRPDHPAFRSILGQSPALAALLRRALSFAPSDRPVLILGEGGVGKEGLARAIHDASGRSGPFHAVDLGAIQENVIESELFGHARGAFTGADRARMGAFRSAEGGTILLDELGNLSLPMQTRLLRVLQERKVQPVGEDRPIPINVRVIAATNADLEAKVRQGEFREDLWHRLAGFLLRVPPLRQRADDIILLGRRFFARHRDQPLPTPWITPEAETALQNWRWPGNIRELENRMDVAAALCPPGQPLAVHHLDDLNPQVRRPVPTLVTAEEGATAEVPRALWHAISAITLRVPSLVDRDEPQRQERILAALDGVLVRADALDALVSYPWWGGFPELMAAAGALRVVAGPVVTLEAVQSVLPALGAGAERPIHAIVSPHVDASNDLRGLTEVFHAGALLIGRVSDARAAEQALAGKPALEELQRILKHVRPACMNLSLLPRLSRVHFVLTRDRAGLRIHPISGSKLGVWAGTLTADVPLQLVPAGRSMNVGSAGEVEVRDVDGSVVLRIHFFEGSVAKQDHTPRALARLKGEVSAATYVGGGAAPPVESTDQARQRWVLALEERRALNNLLIEFPGGAFKSWILREVDDWREISALQQLRTYLQTAPNIADYCGRLYELEENELLRAEWRALLMAAPERDAIIERLPTRMRRLANELLAQ